MNTIKWVSCIGLITIIALSLMGCGTREAKTLKALAKKRQVQKVYIEEQEGYAPYLVLSDNYDGKVLLLREQVLPELMPYKEHSDLWGHYEYGSYYEQSSVDAYLNQEFLERISEPVRDCIADTSIEVTDLTAYDEWDYATHTIERKVFLLSSVEMGVEGLDGYTTTVEGEPLDYFTNKEMTVKRAYDSKGNAYPYWTRTPELWESCTVVVIGFNMAISENGYHVGVEYDGKIYDNIYKNGIDIDAWIQDLIHTVGTKIERTKF